MNKYFPDELILKDLGTNNGTQVFELVKPFRYISKRYGEIVCPSGFKSTGVSIPRMFWGLMAPTGKYFYSSLFHDLGYSTECHYNWNRKQVDDLFLECMKVQDVDLLTRTHIYSAVRSFVDLLTRTLIYSAVRSFGWMFYKKN